MTYSDCMNCLSKDEVFNGFLGFGLFSDRLPPFLTSEAYLNYALSKPLDNKKYTAQYIFYDNYRNTNIPRTLAIPSPFAYENLCRVIADNWDKIQDYFMRKTSSQSYKVSRIHIRKLARTKALFKMNYDNWKIDGFPEPDLLLDKRYIVKADISNCFPSMYTHSLPWALVGKSIAKHNMRNNSEWYNQIDSFAQKIKDKETHGFLIGPHVSNLLSEIILTDIDNKLCQKWAYIRNIDDYTCYVKSKEDAENFLLELVTELKEYDLLLNQKKTTITELPKSSDNDWIIKLSKAMYLLKSNQTIVSYTNIRNYFDTVIGLANKYDNSSVLSYAFKVVSELYCSKNKSSRMNFSANAISYLKKITVHYTLLYPYLIQFFEETILLPFKFSNSEIKQTADMFYAEGIRKRNYELCSYAVLFSIKNKSYLDGFNIDEIIKSNHCILLLLAYLYCDLHSLTIEKTKLNDLAKSLSSIKDDFDRNWLFVYEVLSESDLHNEYKPLKKAKVSFVNETKLSY